MPGESRYLARGVPGEGYGLNDAVLMAFFMRYAVECISFRARLDCVSDIKKMQFRIMLIPAI